MGKEAPCMPSPTAREWCAESRIPELLVPHGASLSSSPGAQFRQSDPREALPL